MSSENVVPGFRSHGWGQAKVIVLHDWLSDGTSYEAMMPYLDPGLGQWVFMDLRGYGLSRGLAGNYTLEEAARDVLALADKLGWQRFHLMGHSMGSLVVQKVAGLARQRLFGLIAIAPVGPQGDLFSQEEKQHLVEMTRDRTRSAVLRPLWGNRLSNAWLEYKMRRWGETVDADVSAAYVGMFTGPGCAEEVKGFDKPVLLISGAHDSLHFRNKPPTAAFAPLYPRLTALTIADAGHDPMQETPVLLASTAERFVLDTLYAARQAEAHI